MGQDSVGSGEVISLNLVIYFIELLLSWSPPKTPKQCKQLLTCSWVCRASNLAQLVIPVSWISQAGATSLVDFIQPCKCRQWWVLV